MVVESPSLEIFKKELEHLVDKVVISRRLNSMDLEVFSNLYDSVSLCDLYFPL